VQYLRLSVEEDDWETCITFLPSVPSLSKSPTWVEEEERRRIFWNIFILDRYVHNLAMSFAFADDADSAQLRLGKAWNPFACVHC
jgi:hypothetical protein